MGTESKKNIPLHMLEEGEIHWFTKINDEIVYLSADREIITDQAKIDKFLAWQWDCAERLSKMTNVSVQEYCEVKGIPYP